MKLDITFWGGGDGGGSKVCAQKGSSSGENGYCHDEQQSNGNAADRGLIGRRLDSNTQFWVFFSSGSSASSSGENSHYRNQRQSTDEW